MKKVLVIAIALTFALTACALAGANPHGKLAIHLKAHPTSCTKGYPTFTACTAINSHWANGGDLDAMPVFYDLTQYTVVETGLTWPVEWGSGSWTKCKGDLIIGTIINPGDGVAIAWTVCQTGWGISPGYEWLAATDAGRVCPVVDPPTGDFGTVDCTPDPGPYYDRPTCIGCGGVLGAVGDDPCNLPSAAEPSTWGNIKTMFK